MKAKAYIVECSTEQWNDDDYCMNHIEGELRIELTPDSSALEADFMRITLDGGSTFLLTLAEAETLVGVLTELVAR